MAVLNLPKEIEMDILSRLPVESLLRFRCVSKPSRSLISDPYFVKLHLNRSILSKNFQKFFCSGPQSIDYESLLDNNNNALVELDCPLWSPNRDCPLWRRNRHVSVIGSCNGLICYVVHGFNVILYNPSTRVSKELPQPPSRICYYGFAFDSDDYDYKVVSGTYINDDASKSIRFHMFSLRHNSWRRLQDLSLSHLWGFILSNKGIFLNGALHWLLLTRGIGSEPLHRVIVSFDFSKEVFSEMSLDIEGMSPHTFVLGAVEECLCLPVFSEPSVEVWLMKEYGVKSSWSKFITVPYIVGTFFKPLCFLRNGELLLKIAQLGPGFNTKLGSYNTKENTFTKICNCPYFSEEVLYVESLVSPNSIDGNDKQPQALGPIAVTLCDRPHSCGKKAVMMMFLWLIFVSLFFLPSLAMDEC